VRKPVAAPPQPQPRRATPVIAARSRQRPPVLSVFSKREHGRVQIIRTRPCADDHTATPRNASSPECDEISTCSGARARELAACGLRLGSAVLDLEVDCGVLPEVPHRAEQHASFPVR